MSSHELFEVLIDLCLAVTFSVVEFIQLLGWGEEVLQRSTRVPVSVKLARDDTILASGRQFGRRVRKLVELEAFSHQCNLLVEQLGMPLF